MRHIGVLTNLGADDPLSAIRVAVQRLQELGWTDGRNVRIDYRWGASDADRSRRYAAELVALAPDVVVANAGTIVVALQQASRSVPIVFVGIIDAVASGRIESLARPGGNATGFTGIEYGISGKWLELLKQLAPRVTRVAIIRDSAGQAGPGQLGALQGAAPSFGVELRPVGTDNAEEIQRGMTSFARGPNGGLIVVAGARAQFHRGLITALATRHRLPAVYPSRVFVTGGGLISYGPEAIEQWRLAAGYVDRVLKGEKPADLPVQAPVKYETVLDLKTARALGLDVPASVLVRADEVIE